MFVTVGGGNADGIVLLNVVFMHELKVPERVRFFGLKTKTNYRFAVSKQLNQLTIFVAGGLSGYLLSGIQTR